MIHTEKSLRAQDGDFENYHYQLEDGEKYRLTGGELEWLDFVRGRYAIADHFDENMKDGVYTVDMMGLSESLAFDGLDYHAPCLSCDSVLYEIIFYTADTELFIDVVNENTKNEVVFYAPDRESLVRVDDL